MVIELFAAASVGGIVGFGTCAVLTAGKVADLEADHLAEHDEALKQFGRAEDATDAHARCADALNAKTDRIERALACETPKAAHGVRKMAAILRGELA